jgi:Fe-S-cluster containining protein
LDSLKQIELTTNCRSCSHKCCSQPYDWVFLTRGEVQSLAKASGVDVQKFVTIRENSNSKRTFRTLNLPCPFLDQNNGQCTVYEFRPLICRLFPFYLEPLTGHATLLPIQCGDNLKILSSDGAERGWRLADFEEHAREWLATIWDESGHTESS